jgi:hypothetical protein
MASLNMLVSEIAHSLQQADSVPVRRAIRQGIIHARNEIIRKSYNNHSITDKVLQQRVRVSLTNVPDGDAVGSTVFKGAQIKRTTNKVPRPTRLPHNLPFHSVRTAGVVNPTEIAFVKEASSKFYTSLPGMCPVANYDYINGYIYINIPNSSELNSLAYIVIESVFEQPQLIPTETYKGQEIPADDNDEFLLPEDMIGAIKKVILETFNPEIVRDTNEIQTPNLVK